MILPFTKGPRVINTHYDSRVVCKVSHLEPCVKWQNIHGASESIHIEYLTVRSFVAMILVGIIGSYSPELCSNNRFFDCNITFQEWSGRRTVWRITV